jgi:hypothetical protein
VDGSGVNGIAERQLVIRLTVHDEEDQICRTTLKPKASYSSTVSNPDFQTCTLLRGFSQGESYSEDEMARSRVEMEMGNWYGRDRSHAAKVTADRSDGWPATGSKAYKVKWKGKTGGRTSRRFERQFREALTEVQEIETAQPAQKE